MEPMCSIVHIWEIKVHAICFTDYLLDPFDKAHVSDTLCENIATNVYFIEKVFS